MFKKNQEHLTGGLWSFENDLSKEQVKTLNESKENYFFKNVFCRINEDDFKVLYADDVGSPNAPINSMVSSLILMNNKSWSYEELLNNINFNLLTRTALGLTNLNGKPFCETTIFNFQNRMLNYTVETGINLIEKVFDGLTEEQLKELKIKTNIQRTDSTLIGSNIRNFSRLQLLIEIIIRLERVLTEEDKKTFDEDLKPYLKQTSGQFVYKIKSESLDSNLAAIGKTYYRIKTELIEKYKNEDIYEIFNRAYDEHFKVTDNQIEVKIGKELNSGCMQSPDDLDATYRKKNEQKSKGFSLNITETGNPNNKLQLITDIVVTTNNIDDSQILNERLEVLVEKTPDLVELHTDGGYGSEGNDEKMGKMGIVHIQTAIRGRESEVEIKIEEREDGNYNVKCPEQEVVSRKIEKRHKAEFDLDKCGVCPLADRCPTIVQKKTRGFYFKDSDFFKQKRQGNIKNIPYERRKIRGNVESSIKNMKNPLKKDKLKVRGIFKTELFAYLRGICVNFGRIYRYSTQI
jgi:hypothetical protein